MLCCLRAAWFVHSTSHQFLWPEAIQHLPPGQGTRPCIVFRACCIIPTTYCVHTPHKARACKALLLLCISVSQAEQCIDMLIPLAGECVSELFAGCLVLYVVGRGALLARHSPCAPQSGQVLWLDDVSTIDQQTRLCVALTTLDCLWR